MLSVIVIYDEGQMTKYRVMPSLIFPPYFNYVALDYLSVLHTKIDTSNARFSDSK